MKDRTKMCKTKPEDWDSDKEAVRSRVRNSTHICVKCFRTANSPDILCKPKKIK